MAKAGMILGLVTTGFIALLSLVYFFMPLGLSGSLVLFLLSVVAGLLFRPRWYLALIPLPLCLMGAAVWAYFLWVVGDSPEWHHVLLRGLLYLPLLVGGGAYLGNARRLQVRDSTRDEL